MKKILKLVAVIMVLSMSFIGCSNADETSNSNVESVAESSSESSSESSVTSEVSTEESTVEETSSEVAQEPTVIRIGMMASYDVIPYVMIRELGLAEEYNIDLQLETFTSAKDRDAAFVAGELDGVLTDYIGICIYQNAEFDVRITGITDGDYLLVAGKNSGITDISEISGHSIAISENTLIDYSLDQILFANEMESDAVEKEVVARIPDRVELLRNDQIDLGLLPEPFASIVLNDGAIYLGSANDIGLYPAVSAFTKEVLDEKTEAIKNLYIAYNRAVEYLNGADVSEYEDIVIQTVGYPEEMRGQLTIEPFRNSEMPPREDVEKAISWAVNRGLCSDTLTYEDIVFDVY